MRFTIDIPDNKANALLEFLKTIEDAKVEQQEEVPAYIQDFVLSRIAEAKPEDYLTLEEAKKRIKRA